MSTEIHNIQLKRLSQNLSNQYYLEGFQFGLALTKEQCQWSGTHTPYQETPEERETHDKMILISQDDKATKEELMEMGRLREQLEQAPKWQWASGFHYGLKTRDAYHKTDPLA